MARIAVNPLALGFYTVPEAARLIRVGSTQRIYGWLRGYSGREVGPLLTRDYDPINDVQELSFLDLMEVRFVEHFREHGVKVRSLRIASEKLRKEFRTKHPFALERVHLIADRADIFVDETLRASAVESGDRRLRSLLTDNYVMYEAIKQSLLPGVTFDSKSHLARDWIPRPQEFPRIKIDPKVAYGQPATPSGIPTGTLHDAWKAEQQDADAVAYWYGIPSPEVLEAVRFEEFLQKRGEAQAA
jgi:uncharacterized protein (DUF433 family)